MFVLNEQSDVFVDAMAADHHAQLLFLSAYGRDTSIQQLMARLHQAAREGGVDELSAVDRQSSAKVALKVLVGDPKRLEKATGRLPKTGLLGNLVHVWIFDAAILDLDHAAQAAWIVDVDTDPQRLAGETWNLIKRLSPVPLLDAWAADVMDHVRAANGFQSPPCIGCIRALRIQLAEQFAEWVSSGVADGVLRVPADERAAHQDREDTP
ncbi:MAG: hypothetical protein QM750_19910 [Rubrivivax sp.]